MNEITRADIDAAVRAATGNPDLGPVRDAIPEIVDAINELINPTPEAPAKETRVVAAPETAKPTK